MENNVCGNRLYFRRMCITAREFEYHYDTASQVLCMHFISTGKLYIVSVLIYSLYL